MKNEQIFNILLFITTSSLFIISQKIPKGIGQGIAPYIWPATLLGGLVILSGASAINHLIKHYSHRSVDNGYNEAGNERKNSKKLFLSLLSIVIYFLFLPYIGFITASIFFLIDYMYLLGIQKKLTIFGTSVLIVFILVIVFNKLLLVPLPRGVSIFRIISNLLID